MFHYLKFFSYYLLAVFALFCLLAGEYWVVFGYIGFVSFFVLGDALFGDDFSTPDYRFPQILTATLWLALPISLVIIAAGLWLVSDATSLWGIEQWYAQVGIDIIDAKANTIPLQLVFAVLFCGFLVSGIGTVTAHELIHRVGSPVSVSLGRWIMALSFDANFSIEHVYGHHRYVATSHDPATAPRGRNVYHHIIASSIGCYRSSWQIETQRLERKSQSIISWHNQCLRGYAMSLVWMALAYAIAGVAGVLFFIGVGIVGKSMLEIVNYMEHYGIVRDPKQRVMPRHSWNTNKRVSCWTMFNLSRHSHHHAQGSVRFENLKPMPEAPTMVTGYMATLFLTLVPPLWFKLMAPKLAQWDAQHANDKERLILAQQSTTDRFTEQVA